MGQASRRDLTESNLRSWPKEYPPTNQLMRTQQSLCNIIFLCWSLRKQTQPPDLGHWTSRLDTPTSWLHGRRTYCRYVAISPIGQTFLLPNLQYLSPPPLLLPRCESYGCSVSTGRQPHGREHYGLNLQTEPVSTGDRSPRRTVDQGHPPGHTGQSTACVRPT